MRALVLLLCALTAAPAVAAKKKKPAAAAKKPKPAPAPAPEPAPAPKPVEKASTVLLDTNPAAVASQLEAVLAEFFKVGVADTALPDDVDHDAIVKAAKKGRAVAVVTARYVNGVWVIRTWAGSDGGVLAEVTFKAPKDGPKAVVPKPGLVKLLAAAQKAEASAGQPGGEETSTGSSPKDKPTKEKKPTESDKPKETASKEPAPKAKDTPKHTEQVETEAAPAPAAEEGEKPQAVHVGVGVNIADRKLFYTDDLFGALSRYTQPLAPRIAIEAEIFPGAFITRGPASWFGLTGSVDFLVAVTAIAADGTRYPTSSVRVKANLAARIPVVDRLELGITFGYALTTYAIAGDVATKPNVPDTSYSALRPAASVGLRLIGPLWLKAAFGYQILLGTGQLGSATYFPRNKGGGLDLNAGVVVRPLRFVELRATFDYQRYWFSMNPEVGDPYIAGGALDDSRGFSIFAAFTL